MGLPLPLLLWAKQSCTVCGHRGGMQTLVPPRAPVLTTLNGCCTRTSAGRVRLCTEVRPLLQAPGDHLESWWKCPNLWALHQAGLCWCHGSGAQGWGQAHGGPQVDVTDSNEPCTSGVMGAHLRNPQPCSWPLPLAPFTLPPKQLCTSCKEKKLAHTQSQCPGLSWAGTWQPMRLVPKRPWGPHEGRSLQGHGAPLQLHTGSMHIALVAGYPQPTCWSELTQGASEPDLN